jgi:hypothetical protein
VHASKNAGKAGASRGLWICAAWAIAACGPIQYIGTVTQDAASQVAAARSAQADKYAPYEYTAAVEYLHKAREEEGYADHQSAVKFGRLAVEHAEKAKQIALENAGKPIPPNPAEGGAPGVDGDSENPLDRVPPPAEAPR